MLEKAVRISRRMQWSGALYGAVALALIFAIVIGERAALSAVEGAPSIAVLDQGSVNTASATSDRPDGSPQPPR
jgi:hypothetical protein